jgi:hypothetical protein
MAMWLRGTPILISADSSSPEPAMTTLALRPSARSSFRCAESTV